MSKARQCEIGPTKSDKAAIRKWKRLNAKPKARGPGSVSSSVPAPPPPGTSAYSRCIARWVLIWQEAQAIDELNKQILVLMGWLAQVRAAQPPQTKLIQQISAQITALQQQVRMRTIAMNAQRIAYLECVKGLPA